MAPDKVNNSAMEQIRGRRDDALQRKMDTRQKKKVSHQNNNAGPYEQNIVYRSVQVTNEIARPAQVNELETVQEQGIFDTASVAAEDIDNTKSSFEPPRQNDVTEVYDGVYNDTRNVGYQDNQEYGNEHQNGGQHYNQVRGAELVPRQLDAFGDDADGIEDESDEDFDDDQTLDSQKMSEMFQQMKQDPKFENFRQDKFLRSNAPNRFAGHPQLNQRQIDYHLTTGTETQIYKPFTSAFPTAGYQKDQNRYSPTTQYPSRKHNSTSTVAQDEEWQGQLDGFDNEDHGRGQPFLAPTGDLSEADQHVRENRRYEEGGEAGGVPMMNLDHIQPDYDEEEIYKMNYATLKDEPFDAPPAELAPNKKPTGIPSSPPVPPASLEDRLADMMTAPGEHQAELFSTMSKEEWEKSGDWFINKMSDLMKAMQDSRNKKREITKRFEDEITAREEAVRDKVNGIDRELSEMKSGGQGVLNRKVKAINSETNAKSGSQGVPNRKAKGIHKETTDKKIGGEGASKQ